ncbi:MULTISPECIES: competence type IV pilus major pilin ComGC [Bacillus]|uniref:ComG operon protein 3 n=4 Tax=Bacillaceae TaxID=186817 RepID=I2C7Q3_BACAY|nr:MULTISPECIES: competence type IV pilus major pilin ComGC [Bacillus]AFJ62677.1 exogenous DNA-binding (competence) [Bacillus velezensis YAU B9601-Y2]CDH95060.1 exogenous DNA-binding (competence) ComGC [Bacillus velezensis NAU-B3]SLB15347.1 ComG operon protein 3 precursor [Mycobacteroides abscessus subsp. massiliense]AIU82474.1 ComG operon protein 3 precursor [Bacillus velezensis]ASB53811.1 ComG operon protein 3 like protein [Bacillus velezensis]
MLRLKNQDGFTLIEMLIVLFIVSILLLITIPNVTKHNQSIQRKGCEGLQNMVKAQVTAYEIDHEGKMPDMNDLQSEGYIKKNTACPNGKQILISGGEVTVEQ